MRDIPVQDREQPSDAHARLPLRLGFAAALFAVFAALLTFAALEPHAMAAPLVGGMPLSLVLAALMTAFAIGSTGLYVVLANRKAA